jgi:hypothetical protein
MPRRAWPQSVARVILRDGYSESPGNRLKRSQPQAGPALVRRQAAKRPDTLAAMLFFRTYGDYRDFQRWFENVETGLAGGLYVVEFSHPLTGELLAVRLVPESDDAAFTAAPYQQAARAWSLPVKMEIMP